MATTVARAVRAAVAVTGLICLAPGPVHAQAFLDHLKCHMVKDPTRLKSLADLGTDLQPEFAASGCTIMKPRYFCVPVAKSNVQPPPPRPDITGQGLVTDYVCYKLRCPVKPPDRVVTDQFGTRAQTKYRSDLLCVPAVKGTGSTTTTVTTTTVTTTSQPTTCCGAQQIVMTSGAGTFVHDGLNPLPFPAGVTLTLDAGPPDAFPSCRHDAIVPSAGFSVPTFCHNGFAFTVDIVPVGCASGGTDGRGVQWDGGATCPDPVVSKSADTSDGVCNPPGQPCNTTAGGAGANTLGNVNTTRCGGPCATPGLHTLVDIPVRETWWLPPTPDCPDPDGVYNPGTDTLVTEFSYIMSLTTSGAAVSYVDQDGDGCKRAGAGPDAMSSSGAAAPGPCCQVGQTATLTAVSPLFTGSGPLFDTIARQTIPLTTTACNPWPGPASCTLPNGCLD